MPVQYPKHKVIFNRILELVAFVILWPFLIHKKLSSVRRILLIEPFGIGDVLSLSVMLDPLLEAYPGVEILLFVKKGNEDIYKSDDRISGIYSTAIPWSRMEGQKRGCMAEWVEIWRVCRRIALARPDIGIDTRSEIRSQILMCLCGCRRRLGFHSYLNSNINVKSWLLSDGVETRPSLQRFERNRFLISEGLGLRLSPLTFPSFRPAIDPIRVIESIQICLHVGARWKYRKWPIGRWVELAQRLANQGYQPIILGAVSEEADVKFIAERVPRAKPVIADMRTLVGVLKGSELLICLDSGPMNMAETLGIPVVALFGPGDYEMWHPVGKRDQAVFYRLPCNPCLQSECVRPNDSCMNKITIDEVYNKVHALLANLHVNDH